MIDKLLNKFFKNKALYRYELLIINSLKNNLSKESLYILNKQIDSLLVVGRWFKNKEVNLFVDVGCQEELQFSIRDELEIARVEIINANFQVIIKADIIINNGIISKILFNKPPKELLNDINLDLFNIKVKIWFEPMSARLFDNKYSDKQKLFGWVKRCFDDNIFCDTKLAIHSNLRNLFLRALDTKLPIDYLELLEQFDYVAFRTFKDINNDIYKNRINGLSSDEPIIHIQFDDYGYYVIADVATLGALVVKDSEYTSEIYIIYHDNPSESVTLGTNLLVVAVNKCLNMVCKNNDLDINKLNVFSNKS